MLASWVSSINRAASQLNCIADVGVMCVSLCVRLSTSLLAAGYSAFLDYCIPTPSDNRKII